MGRWYKRIGSAPKKSEAAGFQPLFPPQRSVRWYSDDAFPVRKGVIFLCAYAQTTSETKMNLNKIEIGIEIEPHQ
jgi:hypothetical protein